MIESDAKNRFVKRKLFTRVTFEIYRTAICLLFKFQSKEKIYIFCSVRPSFRECKFRSWNSNTNKQIAQLYRCPLSVFDDFFVSSEYIHFLAFPRAWGNYCNLCSFACVCVQLVICHSDSSCLVVCFSCKSHAIFSAQLNRSDRVKKHRWKFTTRTITVLSLIAFAHMLMSF